MCAKNLTIAVMVTTSILVALVFLQKFQAEARGEKIARDEWSKGDFVLFVEPEGITHDVFIRRFRDENSGVPLKKKKNTFFCNGYNRVIAEKLKSEGAPKRFESFIVSNDQLLNASSRPTSKLNIDSRNFENFSIKRIGDKGFLLCLKNRQLGIDSNWQDSPFGFETWLSSENENIRFVRVDSWIGAIHESGELIVSLDNGR